LLLTLFFFFGMLICHLNAQDGPGTITTIAGTGTAGFSGDGGVATSAQLFNTKGLAVDGAGNLFIAEYGNNRVRKVTPDGIIRTVAGNGTLGFSGDGGPATSAQLNYPAGIAVDAAGNLFIADGSNHRIRKVAPDGTIATVAGNGNNGNPFFGGDGGPATSAQLFVPEDVAVDAEGNLFIADFGNSRIRKVTPGGIISTVAGGGIGLADGIPATSTQLNSPSGVALDATGNLFIAQPAGMGIRKVTPAGIITTVAGTGAPGFSGATGVAVDADGNLFIAGNNRIRKVTPGGIITTVVGNGTFGFGGDGGPATCAQLREAFKVVVDSGGNLFIADYGNYRIRKVVAGSSEAIPIITGMTSTWGAQGTTVNANIEGTNLCGATGVSISGIGVSATVASGGSQTSLPITIIIASASAAAPGSRIVTVTNAVGTSDPFTGFTVGTSGVITTIAGNGFSGFSGDGGPATSAQLSGSSGVAVDGSGNIYFADNGNNRIRKVTAAGIITTVAGNGSAGFSGDGGPATSAQLSGPAAVALDRSGNIYITDNRNHRIRKVTAVGVITTVAGNGSAGFSGDGGPATAAQLQSPAGIAVDGVGNLFIADLSNYRIRKVTPAGIITTAAGTGSPFFSGDEGPATSAGLNAFGVAVDPTGNLLIADFGNHRIRKVTPEGIITTVVGNGTVGYTGDGGPATSAQISYPRGVAVDPNGNLLIVGGRIRKVTADGIITTVAGNGSAGFGGDCGSAASAQLYDPPSVAVDESGNIYIADGSNLRIRKVSAIVAPTITRITPDSGTQGGTISANIIGTNLSCSTEVKFDGTGVTATISSGGSSTILPIRIAIASGASAGTRMVTITTSSGTSDPFSGFTVFVGIPFTISNLGGVSVATEGRSDSTVTGYARIQPNTGNTTPAGLAIFGLRQNNVLVSETSIPAALPFSSGRIYVEINDSVNTGIAIANPNGSAATINFFFTDSAGVDLGSGSTTITANGQLAKFLDQTPFNGRVPFQGTFSFTSDLPLAVIALRGLTNERSEFLMSTLPVIDTAVAPNTGTQVIPEYADGGGWSTQIVLVNPTSALMTGNLQFLNPEGIAANVTIAGQTNTKFPYYIPPRSSQKLSTTGERATTTIGSISVVPAGGSASPTPQAVFSGRPSGITVCEAGVTVTTARALRMYVESSGQPGNVQSGIAVANASSSLATVTFELTQLDGSPVAGVRPGFIILAGSGQTSKFLGELFPTLPNPFKGILRIATTSSAVSVVGLRTRYNERGDFLITTTPPIVESSPATSTEMEFPYLADGGGLTTQLILFSGRAGQASSGTVRLYDSNGKSLNLPLR